MSHDPPATCPEPDLNALLPWLVNGTLRGEEESRVRAHADRCALCREELDELSQIALSVRENALPAQRAAPDPRTLPAPGAGSHPAGSAPAPGLRQPIVLALLVAIAAGAIVIAFLALRGALRVPGGSSFSPGAAAILDLGAGALRGDSEMPVLRLGPETETVRLLFFVQTDPASRIDLELRSATGELLHSAQGLPPPDPVGRSSLEVPARVLQGQPECVLLVRETATGVEERVHRFPFRVAAADARDRP